jgi:hypothetical protein
MLKIYYLTIGIEDIQVDENGDSVAENEFEYKMSFDSGDDHTIPSEYLDRLLSDPYFKGIDEKLDRIRKIAFD